MIPDHLKDNTFRRHPIYWLFAQYQRTLWALDDIAVTLERAAKRRLGR